MAVEALAHEALHLALGGAAALPLSAALLVALEGAVVGWRRVEERVGELASAAGALAAHMLAVAAVPPLLAPQRLVRLAGVVVAGRLVDVATTRSLGKALCNPRWHTCV